MALPSDHLIRDYLSRLSAAARGQLGRDEGRALVDRTRDFIERQSAATGPPTALAVGRVLMGLGDPSSLVEQERLRLAADGRELPEPTATRNPLAKMLRRGESWKVPGAKSHSPVRSAGRASLQASPLHSNGAEGGRGLANGVVADGTASDRGRASSAESTPFVPAQPGDGDWFFQNLGGQNGPPWPLAAASANSPASDDEDPESAELGDPVPTAVSPDWRLTAPPGPTIQQRLRTALAAIAAWYRRRPLEASAVLVLGLGGAIYPPLWLLGVVVALPSRVWDGRDKWLGLALPVLLTVMTAWLGITIGGHVSLGHGLHEGWAFGVVASRVAAVLGASYLCWRSVRERRPPPVPPWNRPRKAG